VASNWIFLVAGPHAGR